MVGKLNLAYVNFFKEARGKRVVKISKIVNFAPKTHADFSDDAIYDVKWPHFPSEGSFSEEGNVPAKILCLGVNQEDLLNEAAALGLKITKSLFTDIEPSCDKIDPSCDDSSMSSKNTGHKRKNNKKNKRDKKDKSAGKKPVMAGNPPPLVFKLPCDNGMEFDPDMDPVSLKKEPPPPCKLRTKKIQPSELQSIDRMKCSLSKAESSSSPNTSVKAAVKVSPSIFYSKKTEIRQEHDATENVQVTVADSKDNLEDSSDNTPKPYLSFLDNVGDESSLLKEKGGSFLLPKPKKHRHKTDSESTEVSTVSYDSNKSAADNQKCVEIDLYVNKILYLETELKKSKREVIGLKEKLAENEALYQKLMAINFELQLKAAGHVESAQQKGDQEDMEFVNTDKGIKRKLDYESPFPIKRSPSAEGSFKVTTPKTSSGNPTPSAPGKAATPGTPRPSTPGAPGKVSTPGTRRPSTPGTPGKASNSGTPGKASTPGTPRPSTSGMASSPCSSFETPKSSQDSSFASHVELAPIIYDALTGKTPLRSDGAGKVHLGNNVWVAASLFNDKLSKSKVEPSIAVRDTMGHIYSPTQMAQRSLDGGAPVKGDKSKKKNKMTPHKREALLALHRAKSMLKSKDEAYLDLVSKKAKATKRDKLKEAGQADKKEAGKGDKKEEDKGDKKEADQTED